MLKLTKYIATGAMALSILPFMASAHGFDEDKGERTEMKAYFGEHLNQGLQYEHRAFTGLVTALSTTGFTLKDANGTVYTVVTADARLVRPFTGSIVLSDIKVNDKAVVKGELKDNNTIEAKSVQIMPANTHPALTNGTITAVNGNTLTLQNTHLGVVSNVNIKTDANTQVTKDGQAATLADATVGTRVRIKGLWDETLNILNAIRINIRTALNK